MIDFFVHLDRYLDIIIQNYGLWTYSLLFLIIFAETGFVITPFLPGDSLLFALGALAASGSLDVNWLFVILAGAAILGNIVNYQIGRLIGPKIFYKEDVRFLNKKHLETARQFYEKHGRKTIIITRFFPILRTFAPFVAGIGKMSYQKFLAYNIIGGVSWVAIFLLGGYFFGKIPFIKENFILVIFAIIFISFLPAILHLFRRGNAEKG